MDRLGFYPLTAILTYLGERDGTSLLVTRKYYARTILPMFRWPAGDGYQRYRFQVSPVQGPVVLLQRLNTRRLHKRPRSTSSTRRYSTVQIANAEWTLFYQQQQIQQQQQFVVPQAAPLELLRFLNQTPQNEEASSVDKWKKSGITLLLTYPRSGNTLLRTLLERTTGMVTGSDTRPDRALSKALAEAHCLVGEGVTRSSQVCFVKTHWPERTGRCIFTGRRAILLIHNPYDAMDSYWNLNVTNTHTETVTDEIYQRHQDKFQALVKNEIHVWCRFHRYWFDRQQHDGLDLLVIRFEELTRILQFVFNTTKSSLDSYWQQRIRHATNTTTTSSLGSYQPRTATQGALSIGKSLQKGRYDQHLLDYFQQVAAEEEDIHDNNNNNLLKRFGNDLGGHQKFPQHCIDGKEPKVMSASSPVDARPVRVNTGTPVRPLECPFGRAMRTWRWEHTNNDTEPFPTVPRGNHTTRVIDSSSS